MHGQHVFEAEMIDWRRMCDSPVSWSTIESG
jgi:hypothetical protein